LSNCLLSVVCVVDGDGQTAGEVVRVSVAPDGDARLEDVWSAPLSNGRSLLVVGLRAGSPSGLEEYLRSLRQLSLIARCEIAADEIIDMCGAVGGAKAAYSKIGCGGWRTVEWVVPTAT
jgi:hypothetical protein